MPRRRSLEITDEQRWDLAYHRDHHPQPYVPERCVAILKIADGQSPHSVARQGLLKPRDPDAVYAWLTRYQCEGLTGVLAHQHGGRRRGRL